MSLPPLYHRGSVKNILGTQDAPELIFAYSDRYSVFDWGEMPDHIPHKGSCLAAMAFMFFDALGNPEQWNDWSHPTIENSKTFQELRKNGLEHHMSRGIVDEQQKTVPLNKPTPLLHVHKVDVLRPTHDGNDYQYDAYKARPSNALVPLEVIFRFGVPNGSSLMKRINNSEYLAELGLIEKPKFGDTFSKPIIEFSTKLESTDTYIPFAKAKKIAGLTNQEAMDLKELVYILSLRLRDLFTTSDLFLWDGKFEFAFSKERDEHGNRKFVLVDSIGPDELRLTYDGVQLSKECLRTPYRGSAWHSGLDKAKSIAKERGERDWKRICTEELGLSPQPLAPQFIEQMAQLYKSLSNAMSVQLYDQKIFSDGWSLAQVADTLRKST